MKYDVVMVCPPWKSYRNYKRSKRVMTDSIPPKLLQAMIAYNFIRDSLDALGASNPMIFVWVTGKFTEDCREYMNTLSYKYVAHLIWKRAKWKRSSWNETFEYLMIFCKNDQQFPEVTFPDALTSPFTQKTGSRHYKPDDAYALLENLFPLTSKIQINGRCKRPGWDVICHNPS